MQTVTSQDIARIVTVGLDETISKEDGWISSDPQKAIDDECSVSNGVNRIRRS